MPCRLRNEINLKEKIYFSIIIQRAILLLEWVLSGIIIIGIIHIMHIFWVI